MFHFVPFDPSPGEALQRAQDRHDASIRSRRGGVTTAALDADHVRWEAVGAAIVELARRVREACAASAFCDARPGLEILAARLSEALDDQLDAHAFAVIDAVARLKAAQA